MTSMLVDSFKFVATSCACVTALVRSFVVKTVNLEESACGGKDVAEVLQDSDHTMCDDEPSKGIPRGVGLSNHQLPEKLPSIIEIRKALPAECFRSDLKLSMYYAIKDLVLAFSLYKLVVLVHAQTVDMPSVWYSALLLYWFAQSTMGMALFVAGHDCGHGSFSNSAFINDTMGNILHSVLLCPFYMWKLSHKHHHKHTANFDKDEIFYPLKPKDASKSKHLLPGFGLGLGWFIYLAQGYTPRNVNHFNVYDKMFTSKVPHCTVSLACLAAWSAMLYSYGSSYGWWMLCTYYVVPVFGFGTYLVLITMLHHTEVNVPWYPDHEWDFVKGQLSTVDRHYGFIHSIIHSIGTHQMHHMFIKIPHYHLEEATMHFRTAFPHLVRKCDEPIIPSFIRMCKKFAAQRIMTTDNQQYCFK